MQIIDTQGICDFAAQHYDLMAARYAFGEPLYTYFAERAKVCRRLSAHYSDCLFDMQKPPAISSPLSQPLAIANGVESKWAKWTARLEAKRDGVEGVAD
jgi:hypothetical protein